jgi:hypothetical protein
LDKKDISEILLRRVDVHLRLSRGMEQTTNRVAPEEFRRQARLVGFMGLAGDVVVASVFLMFQPFDETVNYLLALALVVSGLVLMYLFAFRFPRNYEKNFAKLHEPKLK